jgi:glycerophosphoryl diester phosphodiesterase
LRVLTLAEGLGLARRRVNLYLDCKDVDAAKLAVEVIAAKMERQDVIYDTPNRLRAVRSAATKELALMTKWRPAFGIIPLRSATVSI